MSSPGGELLEAARRGDSSGLAVALQRGASIAACARWFVPFMRKLARGEDFSLSEVDAARKAAGR